MNKSFYFLLILLACNNSESKKKQSMVKNQFAQTSLVVLGTVQDAGSPQIGCKKDCCIHLYDEPDPNRMVVSLGLISPKEHKVFMLEATPDMPRQMALLADYCSFPYNGIPNGILLTHAHIGHYTGLMYLGKEAINASKMPVYAMPRMRKFLEDNGPWSQLVQSENISLVDLKNQKQVPIAKDLSITPFTVPHRDEFSETVGFIINGPTKKALFIPDIDKWKKWSTDIIKLIERVDYAFIDATFYNNEELPNRDMSEIPHPFVVESMSLFKNLNQIEKEKLYFIHLNHTNPLLNSKSKEYKNVIENGFQIATTGDAFAL
ncbi:MAG: MBL fold metallo-hydrolase [Bacteroidia bacterium]